MNARTTLLFPGSLALMTALAQISPTIQWQRTLGGSDSDKCEDLQVTSDGGCIVVGSTASADGDVTGFHGGGRDAWVAKLDAQGGVQWTKALGGSNGDLASAIEHTADGGFILAASAASTDGDASGGQGGMDIWLVKLSGTGELQWQSMLGGPQTEWAYDVLQTNDGGYVVVGATSSNSGDVSGNHGGESDAWMVKVNATGTLQWQKALGGGGNDYFYSVHETDDHEFIGVGYTSSEDGDVVGNHGGGDAWVVKISSTGTLEWQQTLGGSGMENAIDVAPTGDGGSIIAGLTKSGNGDVSGWHEAYLPGNSPIADAWVIRIDNTGTVQWQNCLGGSSEDVATSVEQTGDGGFIVAAHTRSLDGDVSSTQGSADHWLVKLNGAGDLQWQRTLGGSNLDQAQVVRQTGDDGYLLGGSVQSNNGDVSGFQGGQGDFWVVKVAMTSVGISERAIGPFTVSPNPATGVLNIVAEVGDEDITLSDASGSTVLQAFMRGRSHALNVSKLPRGTYTITLHGADGYRTQQVVLE